MHINKRKRLRKDLKISAQFHTRISGYFTVDLIEAATGRVKRHLEFKNLITDAGLNALNNTTISTFIGGFMGCGTNATAPANADVALGAEIAPASSNRTNSNGGIAEIDGAGPANAYWYRKKTFNFVEAQANGNLTEIGLFTASSGGTMLCRQLLKDGTGTPTVIVKTATDQLRVTYEIRLYSPADVTVNPVVISGANYSVTTRAIRIDNANAWGYTTSTVAMMDIFKGSMFNSTSGWQIWETNVLIAQTGVDLAGVSYGISSVAIAAYVAGNFYIDYTLVWDPGIANSAGGLGSVATINGGIHSFQMAFAPKLPKDNTKRLTLVVRFSWGRGP